MAHTVIRKASRYVIDVDGAEAGYAEFVDRRDGVRDFNHTVVDPAFRGQGLSKPLISAALEATRAEGKKVIPTCSAVQAFIEKNPEYRDLIEG
ncbi:GNAT family N-acetyltransferase [Corynebacterium anserum]|uniref:GNAT family N-acetyltransferase n=1 Tax=Corynebacterium anserum TaxID=2684406 RepID=A0A7G7YM75_9CORY|nr:GNAT family N-acetyltransferase [Corynebacterium anserum]MBC2681211.1 GNAT family N-acetyltransferase [Corynebacterium anserum]QNH95595.1 GNAT family N-acetyltransferase [Corynebacterium anserum]